MDARVPPPSVPPIEDAQRQYVELFGSSLVLNTYLKVALLGVTIIAVGLLLLNFRTQAKYAQVKPLVIRIDDVGRAQAVRYDTLTYRPEGQAPELKYFLVQFITKHFARRRAMVKQAYAESLYFLDAGLADATIAHDQRTQGIEKFLSSADDEIDIDVKNVTLEDLSVTPYKGVVAFDKVLYGVGNRQERARETFVAQITFVLRDQVPSAVIPVNPLGLTITYFRVDQAFK